EARRTKVITIDDRPAMRDVRVVVVNHPSAAVPIVAPIGPAPAEAAKQSNAKTQSKTDPQTSQEQPGIGIPTGESSQRIPVYQPWIVLRYVHYVRRRRLNDDRLTLSSHVLLRRGLQVPGLLRLLPHGLNGLSHRLLLIHIGVAQLRCPGQILVHIGEHGGELSQRFDTVVPVLFVYFFAQLLARQIFVFFQPALGLNHLLGIAGGRQDLRDQAVRIKRDGCYELLQLLWILLQSLSWRLSVPILYQH